MNLEDALYNRKEAQAEFEKAFRQKINDLKFAYSRENLNEKQLAFIQRDEAFCKATEHLFNILSQQIAGLKYENEQTINMMADMHKDMTMYQEMFVNLSIEHQNLKKKTTGVTFKF